MESLGWLHYVLISPNALNSNLPIVSTLSTLLVGSNRQLT